MSIGFLQSPPMRVNFAGFESTTPKMQRCGWVFQVEQYPFHHYREITITAKNERLRVGILARGRIDELMRAALDPWQHDPRDDVVDMHVLEVVPCAGRDNRYSPVIVRGNLPIMRGADMEPRYFAREEHERYINPNSLFAPPAQEELIVEPETVADLFEKIKSMQQPELKRIRDENRKRAARDQQYTERVSAQIITLERAA